MIAISEGELFVVNSNSNGNHRTYTKATNSSIQTVDDGSPCHCEAFPWAWYFRGCKYGGLDCVDK